MLEALRDGTPKLQQAYLNILNVIFLENISHKFENGKGQGQGQGQAEFQNLIQSPGYSSENDVNKILYTIREQLACPETILPSLLRLIDQGGSSAVRAKALFAAQLLCRYSPHLVKGTVLYLDHQNIGHQMNH